MRNTPTIDAPLSFGNSFPPASVSWRKAILLNRSALLSAWPRHFPRHSFADLRLINPADAYWAGESWSRAAQSYHADRKRGLA
jgi:hypothetical protein